MDSVLITNNNCTICDTNNNIKVNINKNINK